MWWTYLLAGFIGAIIMLILVFCVGVWCCLKIDHDDMRPNNP